MDIRELLLKDAMIMDMKASTKREAIDEMVHQYFKAGVIDDEELYKKDILAREAQSTTGIGDGIAMPHAKDKAVKRATVMFAKSATGVDYDALDGNPVHLFFMIAAPEGANNTHLQALAALSSLLINPELVAALKKAQTPEEVHQLFADAEAKKEAKEKAEAAKEATKQTTVKVDDKPYVVAVTACPTGIAHTYMAEESLKKTAEAMGVDIKVETNGSEGVKHRLTSDEISRAAGVIIAADKKVEMARFDGKPLVNRPVVDGIKKADQLIDEAVKGKAPVYHAAADEGAAEDTSANGTVWGEIYKDLMNGISHMLPFVVGGGILIALSFVIEQYFGGAKSLPFIFLNNAGSLAFAFMIPVLAGYIAESIGDRPALMPGFVGGFMATVYSGSFGGVYVANVMTNAKSSAGFLGGIAAGFIAGYLTLFLKKLFAKLPKSLEGMKPMLLYPIFGLLLVALIMFFIVNPIFAVVNTWVTAFLNHMGTGNAVLLGLILGGMMSIDMGGPFNKAAYVFAVAAFTSTKNGDLMAAVMAGGMVPPFATAIATAFWPKKFTDDERKAGITNWVLGFSFITEGAIPFATADPLRVLSSCILGSATAGALTQWWHVSVPAPHGGFWVTPLASNPFGYIIAVVIGSIIAGVLLGIWRPEKTNAK
ncbi:MAG: fructose-specific PTS transporter subunit EIIC [Liquorilactobacillus nagelii]|jgi:PTS system fructose-specific IIC component|uniref:PTS fructose transporter subunit IIABC n=1 Tax=Liquorilactobacillus nagelii TaxID=82688 RepID=UPI00242E06E7|nr:fructose-specific PTS transporter subunit EIIC [Liquorilactobacillus nagelii]MCI1699060.1 fructose-specific PTS transporter subunit EIIC [Liquorilactobacillus nagelii]MCI1922507.1 fructose-specific PTS transporter subunit EIIC [Liquorilactobacillus nagelii]MCI1977016.1 fructose-specific PTS transporter subunit EIIC [Liquorilactobacillus nagelii]